MLPKEVLQYSNVQFQKISILPHERLLSFRRGQWAGVKASVKLNCNFQREGLFKPKKNLSGRGGGGGAECECFLEEYKLYIKVTSHLTAHIKLLVICHFKVAVSGTNALLFHEFKQ